MAFNALLLSPSPPFTLLLISATSSVSQQPCLSECAREPPHSLHTHFLAQAILKLLIQSTFPPLKSHSYSYSSAQITSLPALKFSQITVSPLKPHSWSLSNSNPNSNSHLMSGITHST